MLYVHTLISRGDVSNKVQEQAERHREIQDLLGEARVRSQKQLVELLATRGHDVTQSSVSRDLQDLGAIKQDGVYRIPPRDNGKTGNSDGALRAVAALLLDIQPAGPNLVIVRTHAGAANAVGLVIDGLRSPNVVGTVAGDDTLFLAVPGRRAQTRVIQALDELRRR